MNRVWLSSLAAFLLFFCPGQAFAQSQKTNFFLPQNPAAAAYILGRLSNQELIAAPRSEFVYVALLKRAGLERKYRLEALDGLATLRHTDRLSELLSALSALDKNGEDSAGPMRDLLPILLQSSPAELAAKRAELEKLAVESQLALTRQIAYAALITADHSIEPAWKQAKPEHLADLILAIPLIRDPGLRGEFYSKLEPLVRNAETSEVRRAAITAIVAVPDHGAETFRMLAALVEAGTERAAAIASLQRIPRKDWPKESVPRLVTSLMDYLQNVPPSQRTDADFLSALQFATDLAPLLPEGQGPAIAKTLRGLGPALVVLRTVYEQMR
ncbi:MAG: hypothetical protein QOJ40_352, partial [Verrucomicrobiota bacterium]